jgi:tRNA modification GTPase
MSIDIARNDTICAAASGAGYSALAIVRVSGAQVSHLLAKIFRKKKSTPIKPFVATRGEIFRPESGAVVDDVIVVFYPCDKSFTGEESLEINCHGNPLVVEEILQVLCQHGARLAQPGEFSLRACLNGKINLAQAESIADLIHAKSLEAKQSALNGLRDGLFERTKNAREIIIGVLAEIEARMDFPQEDLGVYDAGHMLAKIRMAEVELARIIASSQHSLKLHEGVRIVICGLPNAGKSTLLNRLCGEQKAIVHEAAGTTRDVIECHMILGGMPVVLVDVAGIRDHLVAGDIEQIGIDKALNEIAKAEIILWLADATVAQPFSDERIGQLVQGKSVIRVLNKIELIPKLVAPPECVAISAQQNLGVDNLLNKITSMLVGDTLGQGEMFVTRARQRDELLQACASLKEAYVALEKGMVDEVISQELRLGGLALDRLFGTTLGEDVLDKIFSEFCIGK